jgi:hypothetical protein
MATCSAAALKSVHARLSMSNTSSLLVKSVVPETASWKASAASGRVVSPKRSRTLLRH